MAEEVWRADALREEAPEAPGRGPESRQGDAAGSGAKKALTPARRRELVDETRQVWQVSIRRACAVLGGGWLPYQYAARRLPQAVLSRRIREIAETRVRYGYRRIHGLLRCEGWPVNMKRIYRLYTEEGLQLRHKTPKRRVAAKFREDRSPPAAPNEVWAMDFLSDQLFNGRRIRILTIVNAFSRLSPVIDVPPRYRGTDVVETLERVTGIHGTSKTIRLDNGPEFISKALDLWAWLNGVTLDFSRPGKPTDNAFIESFNGASRAECEAWRTEYDTVRPHSPIDQKTPDRAGKVLNAGIPTLRRFSRDFLAPSGPTLGGGSQSSDYSPKR